jgi:hypothetical protein
MALAFCLAVANFGSFCMAYGTWRIWPTWKTPSFGPADIAYDAAYPWQNDLPFGLALVEAWE